MALKVVAIAAPDYQAGRAGRALSSVDPASLFNACRVAALDAENGKAGWGESNWAAPRHERRRSVLLMHSWEEEQDAFRELLLREQPNLLLIGAMTLGFPGAVACAQLAKELFGDEICVVLGGRHASETVYAMPSSPFVQHHPGSPLLLMANGQIESVFDLVIGGEGEYIISEIGTLVDQLDRKGIAVAQIGVHAGELEKVPGKWVLGFVDGDQIRTLTSAGGSFDRNLLPPPSRMFGIQTSFGDCFGGRLTAHAFSDTGSGCAFNCNFCSERQAVTGPLQQLDTSAYRLFNQLKSAVDVVREDSPHQKASAFVEDSTMLAGSDVELRRLVQLLGEANLDIRFGCQFTIDQILSKFDLLRELKQVGLDYIFIGVETLDPALIGGMSKDIRKSKEAWKSRIERVLSTLTEMEIGVGCAILFGLGEQHENRLQLFDLIYEWRKQYGVPNPVSMNWAVQHPLKGADGGMNYTYEKWGTPKGAFLDAFQDFGEASLLYPLAGQKAPVLEEVMELHELYNQMFKIGVHNK